jgi:purine-nucleoside phosphorylase
MPKPKSLLLAAFAPELVGWADAPSGWGVELIGIGGIVAAATTARILAEANPQRVLLIGTCGAYPAGNLKIGDCIAASEVIAITAAEIAQRAYRPMQEIVRWTSGWDLPLPKFRIASPPTITTNTEDAALLGQEACGEHLELAGVFAACHQASVPAAAALVVANMVGPEAKSQWSANHERVSKKLMEVVKETKCFGELL